jgi:hypothetical protein
MRQSGESVKFNLYEPLAKFLSGHGLRQGTTLVVPKE